MNEQTTVTVIVPVFNAEVHIRRTLESLSKQTLTSIEVIFVDDASTDSTQSIIEKFQNQSQLNIVYLRQSENQGVHNARLLGLQHAKGEWIGFVDSDDTLQPTMYEKMLTAGIEQKVDIVICGMNRVSERGKRLATKISFKKDSKTTSNVFQQFCQLRFGTGSLCNKLYRRDLIMPFKDLYFTWRQDINEDMLLNIGCFSKAKSVLVIRDILYFYTHNLRSVSSQIDPVSAFVKTFEAYALAVSSFTDFNKKMLLNVTDLYRIQLEKPTYQVCELKELMLAYSDALSVAVEKIYNNYSIGLALLSSTSKSPRAIEILCKLIWKPLLKYFR